MPFKARFPGKSQNKNPAKLRLSYKDIGGAPTDDGFQAKIDAMAENLKVFRNNFGNENDDSELKGFEVTHPLPVEAKERAAVLRQEAEALANELSSEEQVESSNSLNAVSEPENIMNVSTCVYGQLSEECFQSVGKIKRRSTGTPRKDK